MKIVEYEDRADGIPTRIATTEIWGYAIYPKNKFVQIDVDERNGKEVTLLFENDRLIHVYIMNDNGQTVDSYYLPDCAEEEVVLDVA
jgi:hypothetical protein